MTYKDNLLTLLRLVAGNSLAIGAKHDMNTGQARQVYVYT